MLMKNEDIDVSMSMMLILYEMKFEFTEKQFDLINSQIKSVYWGMNGEFIKKHLQNVYNAKQIFIGIEPLFGKE